MGIVGGMQTNSPKVYLIGAGPGDPELVTVKAVRALEQAEAVLFDRLVNPEILSHCREAKALVAVGKSKGEHSCAQEEINDLLIEYAFRYQTVARLKGGDPFIYGRGGEEYQALAAAGINCEVIPGITAALGAAASAIIPLTHRDYSSSVIFHTGHGCKGSKECINVESLDFKNTTHVIYMGISVLAQIMDQLNTKRPDSWAIPVAIVENATLPSERIIFATVSTISSLVESAQLKSPALAILGNVVDFAKEHGAQSVLAVDRRNFNEIYRQENGPRGISDITSYLPFVFP